MLEKLKEEVYKANMLLPKYKLITFTWGNVSGIDRESGIMAIKPSGVEYDLLRPEDMVLVDVNTGKRWRATSTRRPIRPHMSSFTRHSRTSAALSTRIAAGRPCSASPAAASRRSAPRTAIISTAKFPAPVR